MAEMGGSTSPIGIMSLHGAGSYLLFVDKVIFTANVSCSTWDGTQLHSSKNQTITFKF